jgi:CRISPR-associated exonuclease Cas4
MVYAALGLALLAILLLLIGSRQRKAAGLPAGRIVYSDTGGWNKLEKPLYDAASGLTGRPDYLVEHNGASIPVEVKSGWAPTFPHEGHVNQLAAYLLLVQRTTGKRPPYGLIAYRNRTFAIDYTPELEARFHSLLEEVRQAERQGEASRSHAEPARCARCGYRSVCPEKL